jgi:hypothetical protein
VAPRPELGVCCVSDQRRFLEAFFYTLSRGLRHVFIQACGQQSGVLSGGCGPWYHRCDDRMRSLTSPARGAASRGCRCGPCGGSRRETGSTVEQVFGSPAGFPRRACQRS